MALQATAKLKKKGTTTDKSGELKKGTEKNLTGFILLASEGEIGLGFFFQILANDPKIMKEETISDVIIIFNRDKRQATT